MQKIGKRSLATTAMAIVALMLVMPFASLGTEATVNEGVLMSVSSASAPPGGNVTIGFDIHGALTGFTIEIRYDSDALMLRSYNNTTPLTFYTNPAEAGNITIVWFDTQDNAFSGRIFTATFTVANNASGENDVMMSCNDAVWDNGSFEGSLNPAVGTITVSGGTILRVTSASGGVGDTVMININIEGNPGISGSVLIVTYDSDVLDVLSARAGNVTSQGVFFANTEKPGRITMSWLLLAGAHNDGSMMEMTFKIKDTTVTSTSINVKDNGTADTYKNLIHTNAVSGSVTIVKPIIDGGATDLTIIIVVVLVIIAVVLFWLINRSKKSKKDESEVKGETDDKEKK